MRYEDLGIDGLINAFDTITVYGGSRMADEVIEAMQAAAGSFVDLHALNIKAGAHIAALTRNEAACISAGAASGLMLAAAACIAGSDPEKMARLPETTGLSREIIIHHSHNVGWTRCVTQSGARLVEIGQDRPPAADDLAQAIGPQTAAILYFAGAYYEQNALPLEIVAEQARKKGIPVIVDAAANLPPVDNLWHYTGIGADLVIFSGGKGLRGPQNTGLILGRRDLVDACRLNNSPYANIGRVAKVGKEEIMGLCAAVERFVRLDHAQVLAEQENWVAFLVTELDGLAGIEAKRVFPGYHGQTYPRACLVFPSRQMRDKAVSRLAAGHPPVLAGTYPEFPRELFINPLTLNEDEVNHIASRLRQLLPLLQ